MSNQLQNDDERINEAIEESFPASDPPPWTLGVVSTAGGRLAHPKQWTANAVSTAGAIPIMTLPTVAAKWSSLSPYFQSVLRIMAAFMFTLAGTTKVLTFPAGPPPHGDAVSLMSQIGVGGLLEIVGGILLLVGFCTRPIAFVLCGEMAVAYFQFHFAKSFWPTINGGVAAVLYCFIWLYFSAAGPGPWSLDAKLKK